MLEPRRPRAALIGGYSSDRLVESDVGVLPVEGPEKMVAKSTSASGMRHCRISSRLCSRLFN
jgi:hypothetical protein